MNTTAQAGLLTGAHVALVTDNDDPEGIGRVAVRFPWTEDGGADTEVWARFASLGAGDGSGAFWMPDAGDEVLVVFLGGDPSAPCVIGSLWNGDAAPPESMDSSGDNNVRSFTSRNGSRIAFDDTAGSEQITIETPGGCQVVISDDDGSVSIEDTNSNAWRMDEDGVSIAAGAKIRLEASTLDIVASSVNIDAGTTETTGVLTCDSIIANSVVGSSYTPGVGNIW